MYLTEEEAKKKWCPQVRHEGDTGGAWNRGLALIKRVFGWDGSNPYPEETCNCIASECMMWRWAVGKEEPLKIDGRETSFMLPVIDEHTRGYCGLGGKP